MLNKLDLPDWETCCTDGDGFHYSTGLQLAENLRHKLRRFRQRWLCGSCSLCAPSWASTASTAQTQQGVKSQCWYFHAQQIPRVLKAWFPIRWGSLVTALAPAALLPKLLSFLDSRNEQGFVLKVFVCPGLPRSPASVWRAGRAAPQITPATSKLQLEELLCLGAVLDKHLSDSEGCLSQRRKSYFKMCCEKSSASDSGSSETQCRALGKGFGKVTSSLLKVMALQSALGLMQRM